MGTAPFAGVYQNVMLVLVVSTPSIHTRLLLLMTHVALLAVQSAAALVYVAAPALGDPVSHTETAGVAPL